MIPLWKGSANTWDCDGMGHMNVRVYSEKALEGLGTLAAAIEMPHAFQSSSPSTLMAREQHIRYLKEVHSGMSISMIGCVLEWDETSALIYQEIQHQNGQPAAAFRTRIEHVEARSGRPFPWNKRSRAALETLIDTPPDTTKPRGLSLDTKPAAPNKATMKQVEAIGSPDIGRGLVMPSHCDLLGRMYPHWHIGRISDSMPNMAYDWREAISEAMDDKKIGGAALEYRLVFRSWPRAGDRFVVVSSLGAVHEKTHEIVHWVMNPDTGEAYATCIVLSVVFDLDARKIISPPSELMDAMRKLIPPGLTI